MFGPFKKPSRLSQWNGRRRSSRRDDPELPNLFCRVVLLRLMAVLAVVLGATYLAHNWGGLITYRVDEVRPYDLRARVAFEIVDEEATTHKREEAMKKLPPDLQRNPKACKEAREKVEPVMREIPPGALLVQRDVPISDSQYELLKAENRAYWASQGGAIWRRTFSIFLIFTLLALLVILYVVRFQEGLASSLRMVVGVCAIVLLTLVIGLFLCYEVCWHVVLIPLTVTALILTVAYNPPFALLMSLSLSLAMIVMLDGSLNDLLVAMGGQATAILTLRNIRTRTRLVKVGIGAGFAYLAMTLATELYTGQTWDLIISDSIWALVWGVLAGFIVSGSLPVVERCFAIVTDVSLLELGDGSHPLLQELVRRAPGSYTHSMTVATLAEPCAEAIGANPLLVRVGSYFHDIGKMRKPPRFIGAGLEHAHHHRPRQGRHRSGRAVSPAAADHRFHSAASWHHPGRILLPRGAAVARESRSCRSAAGRPTPSARAELPLSWPQTTEPRERHRHARRRGRKLQPRPLFSDACQSAQARPRSAHETPARRPIRGKRLDPDRVAHYRRDAVQRTDRPVSLAHQIPGAGTERTQGVVIRATNVREQRRRPPWGIGGKKPILFLAPYSLYSEPSSSLPSILPAA